ncbi:hybrid sensor histidine kinase/response regulator [Collimonas pratensis]|uniref:Virulence sensor protein BvgS n=1 Tax=Collimonas pratensis TaxID=279113 RepID=A0A127QC61_9BURK|nr:ATP-binding protein [Collimonas pratensis]AMP07576.1 response regulator [Collimonas pratensis]
MKNITKTPSKQTIFFFVTSLLLTGVMVYFGQTIFLTQSKLSGAFGPQSSNYDAFAQFQISFERMGQETVRYSTGLDQDAEELNKRYQNLQSKFRKLSEPAKLDELARQMPEYRSSLFALSSFMQTLTSELPQLPQHANVAKEMVQQFESMRRPLDDLTNAVRNFEHDHYTATADNLLLLRRSMFISGSLLWANFSVWVALLLLNVRHSRAVNKQQEYAIKAEHQALIASQNAIMSKNTLLGMISHELRTPLQTIISSIDLLTLHTQKKNHHSDVSIIKRLGEASVQLEEQLKDVTDYARLDAKKLSLRQATFKPCKLMQSVVENFDSQAKEKGLKLIAQIQDSDINVSSDQYRIQQIASNLISNAIKYSEQGEVRVHLAPVTPGTSHLVFSVEDTGPGIGEDDLPRLFEPFIQIDQSHARRYEGAGLGLAIVKRLVDLFGGDILIRSALGSGTCFEVSLPIEIVAPAAPAEAASDLNAIRQNRILLVDDNMDVRASLKEVIEQLGYQCEVADSGENALQKIAVQRFDAILLDIQMPEPDGFAVAAHVRNNAGPNQHAPVIGISAYLQKNSTDEELRFFSHYLLKPIRQEKLGAILHQTIWAKR